MKRKRKFTTKTRCFPEVRKFIHFTGWAQKVCVMLSSSYLATDVTSVVIEYADEFGADTLAFQKLQGWTIPFDSRFLTGFLLYETTPNQCLDPEVLLFSGHHHLIYSFHFDGKRNEKWGLKGSMSAPCTHQKRTYLTQLDHETLAFNNGFSLQPRLFSSSGNHFFLDSSFSDVHGGWTWLEQSCAVLAHGPSLVLARQSSLALHWKKDIFQTTNSYSFHNAYVQIDFPKSFEFLQMNIVNQSLYLLCSKSTGFQSNWSYLFVFPHLLQPPPPLQPTQKMRLKEDHAISICFRPTSMLCLPDDQILFGLEEGIWLVNCRTRTSVQKWKGPVSFLQKVGKLLVVVSERNVLYMT